MASQSMQEIFEKVLNSGGRWQGVEIRDVIVHYLPREDAMSALRDGRFPSYHQSFQVSETPARWAASKPEVWGMISRSSWVVAWLTADGYCRINYEG